NGAINLEQTLYAGGAVQAGVKMARLRETRSLWDFQQVVNDTLLKVREQFYAALLAQRQVEVQRESLHLLDEELGSIRRRFQAGTLPRFNVLRAEVELANGKPALIRAENQWRLSLEDLARLLGMQPDEARLRGVTGGLGQPSMDWNLSEALEEARLRRPEIQSRRRQREMQEQNVVIQEAGWKPSLQAFGNYGYQKERFTSSFDQENHGWMVGVKGRIPLFDGLETYGKVAEAKADLRTADWDVSQAELDVEYDVRRAYSEITEAAELIRASQTADSQAREGLREARVRFDAGAGTQLEVLDARVAMTSARLNSLQALHDYNLALARLRRAMGVDHVFRYETEPSP
ncbi:MAG: TolC family protein, partial [Verrucomicrobiae bacterium]|nr:TolC family protein [Verrucomicrobiae bacterium]